jgi:hypothetical protein
LKWSLRQHKPKRSHEPARSDNRLEAGQRDDHEKHAMLRNKIVQRTFLPTWS